MIVRKAVDFKVSAEAAPRTFWVVGSTEDVDRDGDRILSSGWRLGNFQKNPVIPWAHQYNQPPVAKALDVKVEERKLKLLIQFAMKEEYGFADTVYRLYQGGFLSAFSVGFNPLKYELVERTINGRKTRGHDYIEVELWEVSACTVPSNPSALVAAKRKGLIAPGEHELLFLEPMIRQIANEVIEGRISALLEQRILRHDIDGRLKLRGLI